MNALQQALAALDAAEGYYEAGEAKSSSHYHDMSRKAYENAAVYAAVAQAEQLSRIAAALEGIQRHMDNAEARDELAESVAIYGRKSN